MTPGRIGNLENAVPGAVATAAAVATMVLFLVLGGLSSELRKDERFHWPAAQHFSRHWLPTVDDLRTYPAPETPLSFLVVGTLEHATGQGLILGRLLNAALAIAVVFTIALGGKEGWRKRSLSMCGLVACPYFLGTAVFFYTDIPAVSLVTWGTLAYMRGRHLTSALCMAFAIACRQYMVSFPLAIVGWELWTSLRSGNVSAVRDRIRVWLPNLIAASTLGGWFLLFRGFAPPGTAERFQMHTADPGHVLVRNSLYSLTCVGAYFVVVETGLFWRTAILRDMRSLWGISWAFGLGLLFMLFPPRENLDNGFQTMGYLDKAARTVLGDVPRMALFWVLAALAAARFRPSGLGFWLVMANAAIAMKAHIGWDKYAVPVLASLWLLESRGVLDLMNGPPPLSPADKDPVARNLVAAPR